MGLEVLVYCTYRPPEEQAVLLSKGLTRARPYMSWHQYRRAFDCVPLVGGKPLWQATDQKGRLLPEFAGMRDAADAVGLEWAGRWKTFREFVHFQSTGGLGFADAARDLAERGYISPDELDLWLLALSKK